MEQILFLLEKFGVGDSFYHELSMSSAGVGALSRSYLIKQRRYDLNNLCHVTPTPWEAEGAQISFHALHEKLEDFWSQSQDLTT